MVNPFNMRIQCLPCSDDTSTCGSVSRSFQSLYAVAPSPSGMHTPFDMEEGLRQASEERPSAPSAFSGPLNLFSQPVDTIRKKRKRWASYGSYADPMNILNNKAGCSNYEHDSSRSDRGPI